MTSLTKTKVVLYLGLIFAAGGLSGSLATWSSTRQTPEKPRTMGGACNRFKENLQTRLQLTPEQDKQVQAVLDETRRELETVEKQCRQQAREVFEKANLQIASYLTPEQQEKFEQYNRERKERMSHKNDHPKAKN